MQPGNPIYLSNSYYIVRRSPVKIGGHVRRRDRSLCGIAEKCRKVRGKKRWRIKVRLAAASLTETPPEDAGELVVRVGYVVSPTEIMLTIGERGVNSWV